MPKITINNKEIEIEAGASVMQACTQAGVEIPHFCYHKRLEVAGNCRMCLVEMERSPKLVASCAMPVSDGMVIRTDTEKVQKAREGVMEFLLINHPLDCPICDQGGECDLQDQAFKYGGGSTRFEENKRSVKDKNLGPLVKTHMTRCIHCTRCIRFATDVAGVEEIGATGRGEHMEVVSYLEGALTSELSGNVIDLCPVGALTSKPYAFNARNWELEKISSIDVMDAMGSSIRIDSRNGELMRILPLENDGINEEWISDKARFSYDGLKVQRLDKPYLRVNGKIKKSDWDNVFAAIARKISSIEGEEVSAIAGTTCNVESMFLLKNMLKNMGSDLVDVNQFGYEIDNSSRQNYLFNTEINNIDSADICLLIGANPRQSAPVLNARIGRNVREQRMLVARIGESDDQTYPISELGNDVSILQDIAEGKGEFSAKLANAKNPMIIIGDAALVRHDAEAILSLVAQISKKYNVVKDGWNGFNILHNHASMVGALDIGFYGGSSGSLAEILKKTQNSQVKMLYLLAADEIDPNQIGEDCFVVYQGHHGDKLSARADVILPEAAYTEQDGIFVNMEGKVQYANKASMPVGNAMESWKIIASLAKCLDINMHYDSLNEVRQALAEEFPIFSATGVEKKFSELVLKKTSNKLEDKPLKKISINYYQTDAISRASVTMAKCVRALKEQKEVKNSA